MKAKPYFCEADGLKYVPCEPAKATHIELHMPGPLPSRILPVIIHGSRRDHPSKPWTWNGDVEKPTLKPSILSRLPHADKPELVCHTWVTNGQAIFLPDCTHELAGKTVDLLNVE